MKTSLINFVLFQLGWLACVISAANQQPLIGVVIASLIIVLHVWRAKVPGSEVKLIGLAVLIGLAWDSVLVWQGVLVYSTGMWLPFLAPYWIIMMWALFATTLNVSLRWLKGKFLYAVTFGAIGGPLAYYAGQRLGAVEFSETYLALGALFVGWAVFTPLLMVLSERFDGYIEARA